MDVWANGFYLDELASGIPRFSSLQTLAHNIFVLESQCKSHAKRDAIYWYIIFGVANEKPYTFFALIETPLTSMSLSSSNIQQNFNENNILMEILLHQIYIRTLTLFSKKSNGEFCRNG